MNSLNIEINCKIKNTSLNRKVYPGYVRQYMADHQGISYNEAKKITKPLYQQIKNTMSEKDKNMYISLNDIKYVKPGKVVNQNTTNFIKRKNNNAVNFDTNNKFPSFDSKEYKNALGKAMFGNM